MQDTQREVPLDGSSSVRDEVELRALQHQHGAIARAEALAGGMTVLQIDRRVRRRQWIPAGPQGWYLLASQAGNPLPRLVAGTRALEGPAWASSALALHELGSHPDLPMIAAARCYRGPGVTRVHVTRLRELPRTTILGIDTVTAAVAVVAAARWLRSDTDLAVLIDRAIRQGATTWLEVEEILRFFPRRGRGGSTRMRQVLTDHAVDPALPLSDWGRWFVVGLVDAGLPRPRMEHRVIDPRGRLVAQVDAAYPDLRYAIELDSKAFHLSPEAFERDRERDGTLAQHGWTVRRFTWDQWHNRRRWVLATIQSDLARSHAGEHSLVERFVDDRR